MALSPDRIHRGRPTPYPWEREALDLIYARLDDQDPHQAWELHELHDPSSGRLYEIDLLFLSRQGLFHVEIKSHPGALHGDIVDWTFLDGGRRTTMVCPYSGANLKTKVLADLLRRQLGPDRPFVHTAVFLPNVTDIRIEGGTPPWLLTRKDVGERLTQAPLDGKPRAVVSRKMMRDLVQAAHKLGLRASRTARIVGGYRLGALVDDGEGYQEHVAQHSAVEKDTARVRSYLVPGATSSERRGLLERAARREAQVLSGLGQHPGILAYRSFVEDGPLGPAVVFEACENSFPLHVFLRQYPDLTFDERLSILQQVVEALAHCHRAGVLHRNLSPASVLVEREASGKLRARLHRFQAAAGLEHSSLGTRHVDDLIQGVDRLYLAPEVLSDPDKAGPESDAFSVGCLAWLLFTGQHPAATLSEREARIRAENDSGGGLRPSSVRPDLAKLDEPIAFATHPNRGARVDDVGEWFDEYLLEAVTRPLPPATPEADPREAQRGDPLPTGLRVERRLGKGATALVLHVRREGRDYALKVPHDEACGERLASEAAVLRDLRHEHIVALRGELTLGGLPCLLLEFAGERTLGDLVREQGALPLEVARRYGDDLLSAVQYLEESGITHRDIKPGNVGFTSLSKKQSHLLLLDFSISGADPSLTNAGTAEWRDPWLYLRPAWDSAADRWAAAAVLYHAVTAAGPPRGAPGKEHEAVAVESERFDAAIRDKLTAFFRRAFARDPSQRFPSAEAMRQAWTESLAGEAEGSDVGRLTLDQVRPETPVDALPLSARARNALDRAGVATAAEVLELPRNQLSVVRGVGTLVAREILAMAEALRARLTVADEPLLPGFLRPRLVLTQLDPGLPPAIEATLSGAGLTTTLDVAQASRRRVERLVGAEAARSLRARLEGLAAAEPAPGSLADWVRSVLGRASESDASKRIRVLVGLDPLPGGLPDDGPAELRTAPQVAAAFGIEPAHVHSSLQFLRNKRWTGSPVVTALTETLSALLEARAPAVPLEVLAHDLAVARAGPEAGPADDRLAAVLIRVALEVRPHPVAEWRRIGARAWLARERVILEGLAALAMAADGLAATEPLPSIDAVRAALLEAAAGTPLTELPHDRRVALAAAASSTAGASARTEIYPRGMDAGRALTLSLGALVGDGLTPEIIRRRVSGRFPEAAPIPDRPELDALLAAHGLVWSPDLPGGGQYVRPGQAALTSATVQFPTRRGTSLSALPARPGPDAQRALSFEDQLRRSVNPGRFRVVQVPAHMAARATNKLARTLDVPPISLDHALAEAVRAKADELGVEWTNVVEADRAGPEGADWPLLEELVGRAAEDLLNRLLADHSGPLLLAWPGAFARYGLASALAALVERSERGDGPPVVLVVPSHADGLPPSINGRLPVPAPLLAQRLLMPEAWLSYGREEEA